MMSRLATDDIDAMVLAYGTPLYLYDLGEVERRAIELFGILPLGSTLLYSLKANPLPTIVEHLRRSGCGAEVSSVGELRVAVRAGFDPSSILYTGPGKSQAEVLAALSAGVTHFSVESWTDLKRLKETAAASCRAVECLLRINPPGPAHAKLSMVGSDSRFGFEPDDLAAGVARLEGLVPYVEIIGFHIYHGTQVEGPVEFLKNTRAAIQVAEDVAERMSLRFQVLDVGGGFPWPYARPGVGPGLDGLRQALAELLAERERAATHLWFESGRYFTASSGTLLTTVLDVKRTRGGRTLVILDTGIHHLGGMSGLGRLPRVAISLSASGGAERDTTSPQELVDLVGPLCTPLDCLARDVRMPCPRVGDVLRIPNVGAYGLTASLYGFLSRPSAVEVVHRDGRVVGIFQLRTGHRQLALETVRSQRDPLGDGQRAGKEI